MVSTAKYLSVLLSLASATAQAQNMPEKIKWRGRDAYRLTDGVTEAVVVPALSSRLMVLRFIGQENALWNAPESAVFQKGEWANWGGEKAWPSPQTEWTLFSDPSWPPHPTYDGRAHRARLLPRWPIGDGRPDDARLGRPGDARLRFR